MSSMAEWNDPIREHLRLREEAARIRSDAVRTRILAVHTWCDVAKSYMQYHSVEGARITLDKVHKAIAEIDYHLRSPEHVLPSALDELWNMLQKVEVRVREIEQNLAPPPRKKLRIAVQTQTHARESRFRSGLIEPRDANAHLRKRGPSSTSPSPAHAAHSAPAPSPAR